MKTTTYGRILRCSRCDHILIWVPPDGLVDDSEVVRVVDAHRAQHTAEPRRAG